ncbi:MAG: flavodoxin-dependent (E)-4-hydroxy-3-methylbut-2-enyl-diphosphate synthase, partial [Alistipes sp.]|nr:flavodoxin-dependent (E)-4-hydroxy-3-methylbut-2-enyl-diphosphate synthase [Alistipes sp.]
MGTTLKYSRRISHEVAFGGVTIGGKQPIAVQSMANTPTADVERSVEQTIRIA